MPEITLEPLPMEASQKFWADKTKLSPSEFSKLSDEARVRAFAVSGIAKGEELTTVFDAMQRAIDKGTTFTDFKKDIREITEKRGWTGKRGWRVETIFRTNIQTAYSVGRYKEMQAVKATRPYWQYSAVNDSRTRPTHAALHGKVFPADHPFWDKWYPPNGFNCRCGVVTLSQSEIDRDKLKIESKDPTGGLIEPIDPVTKQRLPARPLMPDRGFDFNPGKVQWGEWLSDEQFRELQSDTDRWDGLIKKGFKDLERKSAMKIKDYKTSDKELWYRGNDAVEKYNKSLLGKTFKDVVNEPLIMTKEFITHLNLDGRERFLPLIEDIVSDPYEIWLQAEKEKLTGKIVLRKRYVDFVKVGKEKPLLFIAEASKGQWLSYTFFPVSQFSTIDNLRKGIFLYGR